MLHVRGPDIDETPSSVLNRVHTFLYQKYKNKASQKVGSNGSKASAALLQEFLTAWKKYINNGHNTSSIFTNEIMKNLEERIFSANSKLGNNLFKFRTYGGATFEKEFTKFIYGVLQSYSDTEINLNDWMKKANVGEKRTTSTLLDSIQLDKLAYELTTSYSKKISETIAQENARAIEDINKLRYGPTGHLLSDPKFRAIQQKIDIDVAGANVDIEIDGQSVETPELEIVLNLLSKATFTAKNYGTGLWVDEFRKKRGMVPSAIYLGNTNIYRAVTSVLTSLGWKQYEADSIYYATYAGHNENAINHFTHLRFIYELTGRGQLFTGEYSELREAEYLVWNDYITNNIVVRSTADLVQQLMDGIFNIDLVSGVHIHFNNLR